jgi:predicted TIM-barrel fold metal-dependent hydrolase
MSHAASAPPEPILEPDLPIVDPHHHLWDRRKLVATLPPASHPFETIVRRAPRYLLDELLTDLGRGHNVTASVYVECGSAYRAEGPPEFAPVGETEFVNGVGAMAASRDHDGPRACAGIVGHADLTLGDRIAPVLEAHLAASSRFRGIRHSASADADPAVLGPLRGRPLGLLADAAFRAGFARLAPLGLSYDCWLLEPQLDELADLAAAFPHTSIVLDHVGTPLGIGRYAGQREARFPIWRDSIRRLAERPNVVVKLGGLAMPFAGFEARAPAAPEPESARLAALWAPYVETCIEAFGPDRCMFESNFPVDLYTCAYDVLWNAFKRIAAAASVDEKAALFSRTATRVYRL